MTFINRIGIGLLFIGSALGTMVVVCAPRVVETWQIALLAGAATPGMFISLLIGLVATMSDATGRRWIAAIIGSVLSGAWFAITISITPPGQNADPAVVIPALTVSVICLGITVLAAKN